VFLEFELPRRRRRVDAIVLARDVIYLIELKVGASTFDRASKWQVEQYALDLRDFHSGSKDRTVVPCLVATGARIQRLASVARDRALEAQTLGPDQLGDFIVATLPALSSPSENPIDVGNWEDSPYRPTPSIVDAARLLYEGHDVKEIAAADSQNLDLTVDAVADLIVECRRSRRNGIAFITGAPGSGKTLAGLQVAHSRRLVEAGTNAGVFLSGNMPLVEVISEALAGSRTTAATRAERRRQATTFIQHAFAFRNEYAEHRERVPHEHVVLFDEAQRAWDARQVSRWTRGLSTRSEPEILLDVMSRHPDWSVVVAMIGSGQEINTGEAGLQEWGRTLEAAHSDWLIRASPDVLPGAPDRPGGRLFDQSPGPQITLVADERLNLVMNVRSPRADRLNSWVDAVLDLDAAKAKKNLPDPVEFPIGLTRDLAIAKAWLKDRADDSDRSGLVASASARRLRAWGLDTNVLRQDRAWADWFLRPRGDVRGSDQLEVPATNFDCQGLEMDWVAICWGNDLVKASSRWHVRQFRGTRWVPQTRSVQGS
jgi:hypothetical protein